MQVRFWGVRGSCPAPVTSEDVVARLSEALWRLGCDGSSVDLRDRESIAAYIETLPQHVRGIVGSNTPCVEMRTDAGDLFIIDFGSGLRSLGNELIQKEFGRGLGVAHCFLSHFHWDHIQGWPFFKPCYVPGNQLDLYTRHDNLAERLRRQQEAPFFPPASWDDMRATINFHQMDDEPLILCDGRVKVTTIELEHPSKAYAYRFEADGKSFVYASDGSYHRLDDIGIRPYVDFYRDADMLVFDAQFTLTESFEKRSWGHSSAVIGVELACQSDVKNLVLFHHDPGADDVMLEHLYKIGKQYAAVVPCSVRRRSNQCAITLAREGLVIDL